MTWGANTFRNQLLKELKKRHLVKYLGIHKALGVSSEPAGKDHWLHFTQIMWACKLVSRLQFLTHFFFQQQLDKVVIHIPCIHPFKVTVQFSGYLIQSQHFATIITYLILEHLHRPQRNLIPISSPPESPLAAPSQPLVYFLSLRICLF